MNALTAPNQKRDFDFVREVDARAGDKNARYG
jgi:hypothetical protein